MQSTIFRMTDPSNSQRSLSDQAVVWLVRLQAHDATDADRARFASWYATSDAHRSAYSEAEAFVGRLRQPAQAVWEEQHLRRSSAPPQWTGRRLASIAACLAVVAAGFLLWPMVETTPGEWLTTHKGEQRRVELADGSSVLLNSNTELRMAYSDHRRQLALQKGEAFFTVAKDSTRPFEVTAAGGLTKAVGTEFNVRVRDAAATVTVTEGVVEVSQAEPADEHARTALPIRLHPSETVRYSHDGMGGITRSDTLSSLAWRRGQFVFNQQPLGEVIEELNQQWNGHVFVGSGKLRQLPVNGVFDIHDPPAVVRAIERTFHVRSVTLPFQIIVLY
ncbi:MAG TPA: hypothetical protein DCQ94_14795 [Nitrospira sp.]|jgi:transmembrane sensor|nr:hypothetical protein [Nitrospira sp.]